VAARLADGRFVFPGECEYALLYRPIQDALGTDADATLDRAVGLTGDALRDVLAPEPDPAPTSPEAAVFLHPGGVSDAVLADLTTVAVEVSWPDWMAQEGLVICTRIDAGWNDCVDTSVDQPLLTQMYVDPGTRVLDWFVLGQDGDTNTVLADLGGVQVAGTTLGIVVSGGSLDSLTLVAG
jgi:hypothetical protein